MKRKLKTIIDDSVGLAKGKIAGFLDEVSNDKQNAVEHTVAALVKTLMAPEQEMSANDVESFRVIWSRYFTVKDTDRIIGLLYSAEKITIDELHENFNDIPENSYLQIFAAFMELGANSQNPDYAFDFLYELSEKISIDKDIYEELKNKAVANANKRKKLIRSGAGILVALVIIAIFILTATLLKSVIFGLLLAAIMLPIERFFERKLDNPKSILSRFFAITESITGIFGKMKNKIHKPKTRLTSAEKKKRERLQKIRRAVSLSSFTLLIFVTVLVVFFGAIAFGYLSNLKATANEWAKNYFDTTQVASNEEVVNNSENTEAITANRPFVSGLQNTLDNLKTKFANNPLIKTLINELSIYLNNPESQREIFELLSSKTGGIFGFAGKVFSTIGSILLDILLTIFFFLLFLSKIAEFSSNGKSKDQNYIVRTIFNGNWLPKATEDDLKESERIVGELGHKLKVWCRGYLLLMTIDFTVYSIAFYFLNVPYFIILAALAGLALLLPFIGPISSCVLTVLVTLAVGGDSVSGLQIAGIIGTYLLHNGVTEQFILYPMVIGESLGLTTLETIIVVLLGGIFAGITGMIFALPAASVIKYLIPQIYNAGKVINFKK